MSQLGYILDVSSIPESERYAYYQKAEYGSCVISPFDPRLTEFKVFYDETSPVTSPPDLPYPCKVRQIK